MWYNDLGFTMNPFDDSADHKLVGYETIIDDVLYNINAGNIIFIEGEQGSGKTAILKKAIQSFMGKGKVAYVECQKIKDLNIENVLIGKYNFVERLFKKMPMAMIVLIDDVNEIGKKNTERLKYFYDQNYVKAVVFTGESYSKANFSESLKDRVKEVIKIESLKDYHAVDIVNSRLGSRQFIPEDVAKEVFERTDGNPRKFLAVCEELCKIIAESKEEKATIANINKALADSGMKEDDKSKKNAAKKKNKEQPKKEDAQELRVIYPEGAEDVAERYY